MKISKQTINEKIKEQQKNKPGVELDRAMKRKIIYKHNRLKGGR